MTAQELKLQTERVETYRKLAARLTDIETALAHLRTPVGHHKCSAFTGNTRESRRVESMRIYFTRTLGGEEGVDLALPGLNIPACALGLHIEAALNDQKKAIYAEMEKL